jgi:hypothetical protein
MKTSLKAKNPLMNERGILTLDFIFAFMVAFGFSSLLFMLAFTLTGIEISQYITYSVSRSYMGANESEAAQVKLGNDKFAQLMNLGVFRTYYKLGWIVLSPPELRNFTRDLYPEQPVGDDNDIMSGARIKMDAKITHMRIPILGKSAKNADTGVAFLNSYLMREVTTSECREQFNRLRADKIRQLKSAEGSLYSAAPAFKYALITDNGC